MMDSTTGSLFREPVNKDVSKDNEQNWLWETGTLKRAVVFPALAENFCHGKANRNKHSRYAENS